MRQLNSRHSCVDLLQERRHYYMLVWIIIKRIENGIWESSKDFDKTIMAIGKNRKYLLEIFKQLSQNGTIPMYEEVLKLHINRQLNQRLTEC